MVRPVQDDRARSSTKIAKEYAGRLKVAKLNIDENQATPPKYGIRGIPTLMLFKNGAVEAHQGRRALEIAAHRLSLTAISETD